MALHYMYKLNVNFIFSLVVLEQEHSGPIRSFKSQSFEYLWPWYCCLSLTSVRHSKPCSPYRLVRVLDYVPCPSGVLHTQTSHGWNQSTITVNLHNIKHSLFTVQTGTATDYVQNTFICYCSKSDYNCFFLFFLNIQQINNFIKYFHILRSQLLEE